MTWTAVANPAAGASPTGEAVLRRSADAAGLDLDLHVTTSVEAMRDVIAEAIRTGRRRFISIGGDGTTHHLVNAILAERGTPETPSTDRVDLGLVPVGSGSDLARTFALPQNPTDAMQQLVRAEPYPIDIGHISVEGDQRFFVNACNIGVAAGAVRVAGTLPRRVGKSKYVAAFWLHLIRAPIVPMEVSVDHHRYEGEAINVVIANGQYFGGGLNVAPRATMTDGIFDVQVFRGPKRRAFSVMPRVIGGAHLTHPAVRRYVGRSVTVESSNQLPVEADGELLGSGSVEVTMMPAAINLMI